MNRWCQGLLLAFLGLVAAGPSAAAIEATAAIIVDDSTTMPGTVATQFRYLAPPAVDGGTIVFNGGADGPLRGIYAWSGGALARVADNTQTAPGSAQAFFEFGLPDVAAGTVSFIGTLNGGGEGIYQSTGGALSELVGPSVTLPGLLTPRDFTHVSSAGTGLVAQSTAGSPSFVHRLLPGPAELIAIDGQAAPGGGTLGEIRRATTDGSGISFLTGFQGESRRALMLAQGGGLSVIAEAGTVLPDGQVETLLGFSPQSHAAGRVAFIAKPVGLPASIYQWQDGQITQLVTGTSSPSNGGDFDVLGDIALADNGDLAFVARNGLWIQSGGQRLRVLANDATVDGRRAAGFFLDPAGISANTVAVKAILFDGSEAILRVDYTVTASPPAGGGGGGGGGTTDLPSLVLLGLLLARRRGLRSRGG